MPKKHRLTGSEIRRLKPEKRLNSSLFSLSYTRSEGSTKTACVVSKKVAVKAVDRNRIKRRMRTVLRELSPLPTGYSMVLTAKKLAAGALLPELRADIESLLAPIRSGK